MLFSHLRKMSIVEHIAGFLELCHITPALDDAGNYDEVANWLLLLDLISDMEHATRFYQYQVTTVKQEQDKMKEKIKALEVSYRHAIQAKR